MKDSKGCNTYLPFLVIVAVVAIVAIVVLVMKGNSSDSTVMMDEEGNIAGEAIKYKAGGFSSKYESTTGKQMGELDCYLECIDTNSCGSNQVCKDTCARSCRE